MVLTLLLPLPSPSSIGRLQFSSPWDMVVMVPAMVEVVVEEGKEGVVLTLLLILPTSSSISSHLKRAGFLAGPHPTAFQVADCRV